MNRLILVCLAALHAPNVAAFHVSTTPAVLRQATALRSSSVSNDEKKKLLGLLGNRGYTDPVLADPKTKDPLQVSAMPGVLFGGESVQSRIVKYNLVSAANNTYRGSSDTYLNLLEPVDFTNDDNKEKTTTTQMITEQVAKRLVPFIPPPLRSPLATAGFPVGDSYVPMRDLFTSPAVSFAYERGWRQNFAAAGFPGPDKEARLGMDYFAPAVAGNSSSTLVDMSCATGLFTRRFAKSEKYDRVIGCDYSDSMLQEARRRIRSDSSLSPSKLKTRLDLVRCDVGKIPMKTNAVDALHAGAAMHCWPELEVAASEIFRVLKPGGRYFATTFLSTYFGTLRASEGASVPSQQAFQYFESADQLRGLMESGGFSPDKIRVEVLQPSAVIIRCEK